MGMFYVQSLLLLFNSRVYTDDEHETHETIFCLFFCLFFLFFSIALCKDSWEDFTELVEQMQMLDEFKGAYGCIAFSHHAHLWHHPAITAVLSGHPALPFSHNSSGRYEQHTARLL